jgi:hypothetical protein
MTSREMTGHGAGDPDSVESWLVSAGRDRRPGSPLNVSPCPASNFVLGERRAYSRDDGTPGWEALEEIVGGLEGGSSVSFASGMAGVAAIFDQLPTGSVVALPDDCYQGVAGLAAAGQARGRWTVHRIDVADTACWVEMCGVADLIWLESPSNPLLAVADLDLICAAPRKTGAILGVDNTFATPLNQPLWRSAPMSQCNRRPSSSADTRTCSEASSPCATRICWHRCGRPGNSQAQRPERSRHSPRRPRR